MFPAVQLGKLYHRQLKNEKIMVLKRSRGDFDSKITISSMTKSDLQWLLDNLSVSNSPISIVIETDASTRGRGCCCKSMIECNTGGPGSGQKQKNISMRLNCMQHSFL